MHMHNILYLSKKKKKKKNFIDLILIVLFMIPYLL